MNQGRVRCVKTRYRTRVDALMALASIQATDNPRRWKHERRVYECRRCRGWHLTSEPEMT